MNRVFLFDTIPCDKYDEPFTYPGKGSGTEEDPYQITDIKDFLELYEDRDGEHYWILMNDIDASETRFWGPVTNDYGDTIYYQGFRGLGADLQKQLDGQGFKIKNIFTSRSRLAGGFNCYTLKRIGFENLDIQEWHIGGGSPLLLSDVDRIDIIIEECYFTGKIKINSPVDLGTSVFGRFYNNTRISNCYADMQIITDSSVYTVSLKDSLLCRDVLVENVYSKVTTTAKNKIYSPFGYYGNIKSCFWDNDIIKITEPLGKGIGLPTSEMKKRATFESAGWDFENVWYIDEGMDYPKFRVFRKDLSAEQVSLSNDNYVIISPNPVHNILKIKMGNWNREIGISNVEFYDVLGEKVYENNFTGGTQYEIDVSAWSPGIYFARIEAACRVWTEKVIKIGN